MDFSEGYRRWRATKLFQDDYLIVFLVDPGEICEGCDHLVSPRHAFCGFCGRKNDGFNEEAFRKEFGSSLAERQERDRAADHEGMRRAALESPEQPYCENCGKWLLS